jgi:hypothetical protein
MFVWVSEQKRFGFLNSNECLVGIVDTAVCLLTEALNKVEFKLVLKGLI